MFDKINTSFFYCVLTVTLFINGNTRAQTAPVDTSIHTLVVFFDGLRPDYITPEAMPNVYAFSKRSCYGKQHHSVFPPLQESMLLPMQPAVILPPMV